MNQMQSQDFGIPGVDTNPTSADVDSMITSLVDDVAMSAETEFSTEEKQIPAGEYKGSIHKVSRKAGSNKKGEPYFMVNVLFMIEDASLIDVTGREKNFISQMFFLDIDETNSKNMSAANADDQIWVLPQDTSPAWGRFIKMLKERGYVQQPSWGRFWKYITESFIGKQVDLVLKDSYFKTEDLDENGEPVKVLRTVVSGYLGADGKPIR
jgi:hypothetical protein